MSVQRAFTFKFCAILSQDPRTQTLKFFLQNTTSCQKLVIIDTFEIVGFISEQKLFLSSPWSANNIPQTQKHPCWILWEDMGTCHGRSVLSFPVSLVFWRWTSSHWSSVAFVCHPMNHHCQNPEPLYSRRATHPKEGLDIQLATVIAPSVMQRLATYSTQSKSTSRLSPITYSIPPFAKDIRKFGYKLPNNYYFQSSDVMWLTLIIHLLHHVTLVTEMHLWSQRSNHDRRLNKLHTISFIPYTRRTVDSWYSTCAFQPFFIRLTGIKKE